MSFNFEDYSTVLDHVSFLPLSRRCLSINAVLFGISQCEEKEHAIELTPNNSNVDVVTKYVASENERISLLRLHPLK